MRNNVIGALWRLGAFIAACWFAMFVLLLIFAQLRFDTNVVYRAEFSNVSGLEDGNFVRIAGVEIGKVKRISIEPNATVVVDFSVNKSVTLTRSARAAVRYDNLLGGRYLAVQEGARADKVLKPGQTIPVSQTEPALDLDALIGGFRPLFRALDPDQLNALSAQLISSFQGDGPAVASVLTQLSTLTSTLADRDKLIGQVITNLNTVLGSIGDRAKQLDKAVNSVSQLVRTLTERKGDITNAVAYGDAVSATVADLLARGRPPIHNTIQQTDRTAGLVMADRDYVDRVLATLPDAYKILGRQGIYGDYYTFYSCELLLKVNGKGGQPVYVQLTKQASGRCTPK